MKQRLILPSIGLILQIILIIKNRTKLLAKEALLNIARQLSALSPTDLIKNFDKLEDYGICFGSTFASEKCTALLKPKQSVIISKLYEQNNFNFRGELEQLKKLLRIKRPTFFTLNDKFSSIPVLETQKLPTITTHYTTKSNIIDRSSYLNVLIYFINIFKNIRLPYALQPSYREDYLPEGTKIAVLGKYKRQAAGSICCEKPIMMATSKTKIIQKLQIKVTQLKFERLLLIFGITFCLGFGIRHLYSLYLEQKRKKQDPVNNLDKQIYVKSRVCFNCHEKLSNFILEKCGHLNLCKQCKEKLKICPQCKVKEQKGIELFAC